MTTKYTKWPYIIPNGRKIGTRNGYIPTFSISRPSKISIFGMQIYHLASRRKKKKSFR
jgi:hypothetical protein